jgi:hypothetical protein
VADGAKALLSLLFMSIASGSILRFKDFLLRSALQSNSNLENLVSWNDVRGWADPIDNNIKEDEISDHFIDLHDGFQVVI